MSRLMDLFARLLDHQGTCLETLSLTYSQAKLIWRLEANDTPSLKELAKRCGVDPSNLAGVVDQLTERNLVRSRPATARQAHSNRPPDRRRYSAAPPPGRLHLAGPGDPRARAEAAGPVPRDPA